MVWNLDSAKALNEMITTEKLRIFFSYKGDVDDLQHGSNRDKRVISDEEFYLISNLVQDFKIINNGHASLQFKMDFENKLNELFDNQYTVKKFKELDF